MYCPNCGQQLPDEAKFCKRCGTKINFPGEDKSEKTEPAGNTLENVGKEVKSCVAAVKDKIPEGLKEKTASKYKQLKDFILKYISETKSGEMSDIQKWCRWTLIVGVPLFAIFFIFKLFSGVSFHSWLKMFLPSVCLLALCWQQTKKVHPFFEKRPVWIKVLCGLTLVCILVWGFNRDVPFTSENSISHNGSKDELYKKYVGKWTANVFYYDEELHQDMTLGTIDLEIRENGSGHVTSWIKRNANIVKEMDAEIHQVSVTPTQLRMGKISFPIENGEIKTAQGKRFSKSLFGF